MNKSFWNGKKVFITGHTGFKGSWLSLWLKTLGAEVTGYSLAPETTPNLYNIIEADNDVRSNINDIRDSDSLVKAISKCQPEIIFHLAAQALVRYSYEKPIETYDTNVMGTVNLLNAVRQVKSVCAVINITTDKCYENKEWQWPYRENDTLGGHDPYSNSKACSELVTSSFRDSYFNPQDYHSHGVAIATARAGNVIGGGDWSTDRLIPDIFTAIFNKQPIVIRNPRAIRPWQHVLDPLKGYLLLAEKLYNEGVAYSGAWNFGPNPKDTKSVQWIAETIADLWGKDIHIKLDNNKQPHEANTLKLDCSKASSQLNWQPSYDVSTALKETVGWQKAYINNSKDIRNFTIKQIAEHGGDN